jgi:hypothetical protein
MSAPRRTATLTFAIAVEVAPEHPHFHPWPSPGQMAEAVRRAIEAHGLQILELAIERAEVGA